MMRLLARLRIKNVRATFITLTFRGYPSNEVAKLALHAFLQRITRKFPKASAVWRMEYQKRGALHFHLLCFDLPYWHWEEILEAWKACSRQPIARIDVRLVRSRRGVQSYVSKYIAKVNKGNRKPFLVYPPYLHGIRKWRKGRFWGCHNKKAFPLGQKVTGMLLKAEEIKRLSNAAWKIIGDKMRYGSISFHLFSDHAERLAKMNIEVGGLFWDEFSWSRQFTEKEHTDFAYIEKHFSEAELEIDNKQPLTVMSRSRSAGTVQPCTSLWVARASFVSTASGLP
jgi:hypothetical protein